MVPQVALAEGVQVHQVEELDSPLPSQVQLTLEAVAEQILQEAFLLLLLVLVALES
tara:strand:+ start:439 stop:606 length:168 start_codon:yes stop_codon:yes gene_type:complete